MPQARLIRPTYSQRFRCIGSACEDTCCQGWTVPIDREACEKYRGLPDSPLRTLIDVSLTVSPQCAERPKPAGFAAIRMDASNRCPLLTEDRLCRIQADLGEEFLSRACATYPRIAHSTGGIEETALTLSCPEAARLVLLSSDLLEAASPHEESFGGGDPSLPPHFWPIRAAVLALVRNRLYPLWQRLFLLGLFCRRLDSIAKGELTGPVPAFVEGFESAVATGSLRQAMETLPIDRAAQLDAVLRLAGTMLHRSNLHPRFVACVQAFTVGIGNGPGATLESLADRYASAHDRYYAPFFERHPQVAENYLVNTILRCRFPYGREGMLPGARAEMAREFAKLTAQFALMKGLLIGVAGFHRERFSGEHVVHTVQSASKHFDHHPEFLDMAHKLLVESQLDGARGTAILLRDAGPSAPMPTAPAVHAPEPRAGKRV